MAGATVIAQDFSADSDTVTREARNRAFAARIANAERWPDAAPHLLTPDGCPTIGDDSGGATRRSHRRASVMLGANTDRSPRPRASSSSTTAS